MTRIPLIDELYKVTINLNHEIVKFRLNTVEDIPSFFVFYSYMCTLLFLT